MSRAMRERTPKPADRRGSTLSSAPSWKGSPEEGSRLRARGVEVRELRAHLPEAPRGILVVRGRRRPGRDPLVVEESPGHALDLGRRGKEYRRLRAIRGVASHEGEEA